eukprot:SAG22_NODE_94_length_20824_cov_230.693718_19_plen_231_part_00
MFSPPHPPTRPANHGPLLIGSGRAECMQVFLGGNCKTETVGVQQQIWQQPNADFVPVYAKTSGKQLTIKSYDRVGRAVKYSAATGAKAGAVQSDRAVVDIEEAFSSLDLSVRRGHGTHLATAQEVVEVGLGGEHVRSKRLPFCCGSTAFPYLRPGLSVRFHNNSSSAGCTTATPSTPCCSSTRSRPATSTTAPGSSSPTPGRSSSPSPSTSSSVRGPGRPTELTAVAARR